MKRLLHFSILLFIFLLSGKVKSQFVHINNKIFMVGTCPIYFNGANTPWDNWNDFGGSYDPAFWSSHFATLKANGLNSSRVWISCNGDVQPNINTDGTVTGASAQFWANCDHFFQQAQTNGIYIMATMMSFDHTKNTYTKYTRWRNMLNDVTKMQTYIDNYLVPFVNRYKTNPYLMSIDLCNEPEWIAENGDNMQCSYAVLQNFFARCASAIHNNPRADGSVVLVTIGSAATKWNATRMRNGSYGAWSVNNPDGNKWSDVALKAQYNQVNAIIDYYSPHYYGWVDQWYSNPYVRTPTDFGINEKACLIGETPGGNPGTPNMAPLPSYEALKANGYQGHFPWTSNGVDAYGDISNFGSAALAFKNNYPDLVYPPASCTLPIHFLDFGIQEKNSGRVIYWIVSSENTKHGLFNIYASEDGIDFIKLSSMVYHNNQSQYEYSIDEAEYNYFYIESIDDQLSQKTKVFYSSADFNKLYRVIYNLEGDVFLELYKADISFKIMDLDGKLIISKYSQEPSTFTLKDDLYHQGVYFLQIEYLGQAFREKLVIR